MTTSISKGNQLVSNILANHIGFHLDENQQYVDPSKLYISDEFSTFTYRNWKRTVFADNFQSKYSDVVENYGVTIHDYKFYIISKGLYSLLNSIWAGSVYGCALGGGLIKTENILRDNGYEYMYLLCMESCCDIDYLSLWEYIAEGVDAGRIVID